MIFTNFLRQICTQVLLAKCLLQNILREILLHTGNKLIVVDSIKYHTNMPPLLMAIPFWTQMISFNHRNKYEFSSLRTYYLVTQRVKQVLLQNKEPFLQHFVMCNENMLYVETWNRHLLGRRSSKALVCTKSRQWSFFCGVLPIWTSRVFWIWLHLRILRKIVEINWKLSRLQLVLAKTKVPIQHNHKSYKTFKTWLSW